MAPDSNIALSIVVPVFNEELIIEQLVSRLVDAAESNYRQIQRSYL